MSTLKQFQPSRNIGADAFANPTVSESNVRTQDLYRNKLSGELFTLVDPTANGQVWVGSQGTSVIASKSHPNLLAMYTMDNIIGSTLFDESPNGNDATISGATTISGKIGNALRLDGVNDFISLPTAMVKDRLQGAISGWMYINSLTVGATFFMATDNVNTYHVCNVRGTGTARIRHQNNNSPLNDLETTTTYGTGSWGHYVFQSDGTSSQFWFNGVLQSFTSGSNTGLWVGDLSVDPAGVHIGFFRVTGLTVFSQIDVDMYRIFDRALTATEIAQLYNGGAGV